jgi:dynein heavy chain 2
MNEFNSYFRNRVVGSDKKSKFDLLMMSVFKTSFKTAPKSDLLFSFISGKLMKVSREDYLAQLKGTLMLFEREYRELAFVNLDDAVNAIASAEKALSGTVNPHLLLVGASGVGRQTTLLLASLTLKMEVVKLPTVRDFGVREFRKELKMIIESVVNENKKTILFLEDHNFSRPEFVEMINSLIISGEIPGLFGQDEIERLPSADQMKSEEIGRSLQEALAIRVRKNLRVALSLDPRKESFAEMCASNPALFTCNIIWVDPPGNQSLRALAAEALTRSLPEFSRESVDQISTLAAETHRGTE